LKKYAKYGKAVTRRREFNISGVINTGRLTLKAEASLDISARKKIQEYLCSSAVCNMATLGTYLRQGFNI